MALSQLLRILILTVTELAMVFKLITGTTWQCESQTSLGTRLAS